VARREAQDSTTEPLHKYTNFSWGLSKSTSVVGGRGLQKANKKGGKNMN